jgi:glutamate/tyrosine decarboxylase-like PLP-dependent enzyme
LAGTTNLGAVDDLKPFLQLQKERTAGFMLTPLMVVECCCRTSIRLLKGLELADSVTIDPHKWFYAPLDAGAILVKDHNR